MQKTSKPMSVIRVVMGAALMLALFWVVASFGGASATIQAADAETNVDGITLNGPATAALGL